MCWTVATPSRRGLSLTEEVSGLAAVMKAAPERAELLAAVVQVEVVTARSRQMAYQVVED